MASAIPSSIHQKVRFVINSKMITMHGETDFTTYKESVIPYVKLEIREEPSYHSFEMIYMIQIPSHNVKKSRNFRNCLLCLEKYYANMDSTLMMDLG